ncbi:MAG: WYL domain-containing protein [Bacteroidales bacterium]|nr:WYL domain-containing protein [Bacteroidales bacterium]
MVSELIGKYIWLVQTLSAAGERGLTLREISDKHERRYDQPYSRRTFNNHRVAVEDIFGLEIVCDRGSNRYSIPFGEEVMDNDKSVGWLVNTFTVSNLLTLGKERLSGRVSVEDIPSGQTYLTSIMQAMEDGRELRIEYGKYDSSSVETINIQPFAVKEHQRRWYLVAFCHERADSLPDVSGNSDPRAWRVYGLDRIVSLRETGATFKMPKGFDVDDLYRNSYGIYFPIEGKRSETVRFKATESETRYLRDLPLHRTQVEEGPAEGGGRIFRIRVIPEENLLMEFCRLAGRVEVLEPANVREAVKEMLRKGYDNYK